MAEAYVKQNWFALGYILSSTLIDNCEQAKLEDAARDKWASDVFGGDDWKK